MMSNEKQPTKAGPGFAEDRFVFGAMVGLSTVVLAQSLGAATVSWQLTVSLACFCFVLPNSSVLLWYSTHPPDTDVTTTQDRLLGLLLILCSVMTLLGLIFLGFHLNFVIGIVLVVSLLIAIVSFFAVM